MSEWRRMKLERDAKRATSRLGFKADKIATLYLSAGNRYGEIDDWATREFGSDHCYCHDFEIHWDSTNRCYYFPDLDYYLEPPYVGSDYMLVDIAKEFQLSHFNMYTAINAALEHEGRNRQFHPILTGFNSLMV